MSLYIPLIARPPLYNNLDLKKPWLLETQHLTQAPKHNPFLSRAERIRPSDTAEPFASDWTSKCLHFHLLIYYPVASLWLSLCYCGSLLVSPLFFEGELSLKRKYSIHAYVLTFHIIGFTQG